MKKIIFITVIIIIFFLIIYPFVEIKLDGKIIKFSYSDDISVFEDNICYDESYVYNEKRNISIYNFDIKKYLIFNIISFEYKDGNICDTEYLLEESYIENFIENAVILYNGNNIDIKELIKGKSAIVGNKKYFGNDYNTYLTYTLDGKYEVMYIFYIDDLIVIQVGLSDEGPKFIAYK